MVKLQRFHTTIISAAFTTSPFILKRLSANVFPTLVDRIDQILAAIMIGTSLCHMPSLLQPAALPTELPGNMVQSVGTHSSTRSGDEIETFWRKNREGVSGLDVKVFCFIVVR